jgi:hypothetical protein
VYIVTTPAGILVNVALLSEGVMCSAALWCVAYMLYSITLFGGLITVRDVNVIC